MLNLDYASSAPLTPTILQAYTRAYGDGAAGNPSSAHKSGQRARTLLEQARARVAAVFELPKGSVVFTSGATEANHLAIWGLAARLKQGKTLITSQIEHPSLLAAAHFQPYGDHPHRKVTVSEAGLLKMDSLQEALNDQPGLVSVMAANNETGVIQNLKSIYQRCQKKQVPVHSDAVQALRFLPAPELARHSDFLSISGHKLGSPRGVGALICCSHKNIEPLLRGGLQEGALRAGTENVAGAVALAMALEQLCQEDYDGILRCGLELEEKLKAALPHIQIHGDEAPRLPGFCCFSDPDIVGEALVTWLSERDIMVSAGSACSTGKKEASHVIMAMFGDEDLARASVRISLGTELTTALQTHIVTAIGQGIRHLRWLQGLDQK